MTLSQYVKHLYDKISHALKDNWWIKSHPHFIVIQETFTILKKVAQTFDKQSCRTVREIKNVILVISIFLQCMIHSQIITFHENLIQDVGYVTELHPDKLVHGTLASEAICHSNAISRTRQRCEGSQYCPMKTISGYLCWSFLNHTAEKNHPYCSLLVYLIEQLTCHWLIQQTGNP